MNIKVSIIFILLCGVFLIYSFSIYIIPFKEKAAVGFDPGQAAFGRLVWQKHNCQSCHQLYGLGGYLGPDLTNIISNPQKGEVVIAPLVKYGVKQMPAFDLTDYELSVLIQFLKSTDASGISDPRNFIKDNFGMINEHEIK